MPLGELLDVIIDHRGKTPKKLGTDFTPTGVPVASAQLVTGGVLDLQEARCVDEETWRRWMPVPLGRGDVLLTSEAPLGRVAWVKNDAPLVLGQRLFGLRIARSVADSRYLGYWLSSKEGQSSLRAHATGSTVSGIRQSALLRVDVPIPDIDTQCAIGEILGALDDKIAANGNVTSSVLKLGELLVSEKPLSQRALSDVAQVTMGSSPKGEFLNESGIGMRFYQGVRDFGTIFPTPRVSASRPVRSARAGATLLAVRAPVGTVNLAVEEVCIGRGLASITSKERPATLHFCLRAFQEIWDEHQGGGTVFASVNGRDVRETRLCMPEDSEGRLERRLASLLDRAVQAEQESIRLAATRDELLPLLMSGKITVKDAEKAVEGVL